jgi:lysozyme family protein
MTTLFDKCFTYTMGMEGNDKFTNDISDPGGATKYGISLRFLKRITEGDIDHDGDIDADDVKDLSWSGAKYIYEKHFWHPSFENLHPQIASKLFDMRVNMGPVQATKIIQATHNELEQFLKDNERNHIKDILEVDGVMGPRTLRACTRDELLKPLIYQAAQFYFNLADKRPESRKYLLGWLRRTYGVMVMVIA